MKKYYIALAVVGLFVGYFAKYNFWFEDGRDVFFPITKEDLQQKKSHAQFTQRDDEVTGAVATAPSQITNEKPVNLETLKQTDLFKELYNKKVLTQTNNQKIYFEKIKYRLTQKYPKFKDREFGSDYENEVTDRLGLLRAMSHFWQTTQNLAINPNNMKSFFYEVASNKKENLMIRRQAYKNWLYFGKTVNPKDKKRFIASVDSELLHLISLSDNTLIESLTDESTP